VHECMGVSVYVYGCEGVHVCMSEGVHVCVHE